jgi:transcriptional regulator with XRE-family HTH domain
MTTGQKIRKYRRDRDWTQAQLAEKMGLNMYNINRYENDRVRPRPKLIERFAEALQVTTQDLASEQAPDSGGNFKDPELFEQFKAVELLNEADRSALKRIIQAVLIKNQVASLTRSA